MSRQRILYLAHRLPYPPDKGDRIRSWQFLSYLARRHDVWLACFADEAPRPEHVAALERTCRGVAIIRFDIRRAMVRAALSPFLGRSFSRAAYSDPWMRALVTHWSAKHQFGVAIAFSSIMAPYALAVSGARHILDFCDCDSAKWSEYASQSSVPMRWLWSREARRLRREEQRWAGAAHATVLITEREQKELQKPARLPRTITELLDCEHQKLRARTIVIPNGVRVPAYSGPTAESLGPVIGFVGAMDYRPNVDGITWFVRHAWPLIRAARSDAQLLIIGRNPTWPVRRLIRSAGITVTGTVSSVADQLRHVRVGIAPLQIARGIPNKVLELLAARRPVVATSAVAACLGRAARTAIRIVDNPAIFANEVVTLLNDDSECRRMSEAGRQFVLARYAWEPGLQAFDELVTSDLAATSHSSLAPASRTRAEIADEVPAVRATRRPLGVA